MLIKWNTFTYNVCMSAHEQKHKSTNTLNNNGDSHVQIKHFVKFKSQYNMHRTYSMESYYVPSSSRDCTEKEKKTEQREREATTTTIIFTKNKCVNAECEKKLWQRKRDRKSPA